MYCMWVKRILIEIAYSINKATLREITVIPANTWLEDVEGNHSITVMAAKYLEGRFMKEGGGRIKARKSKKNCPRCYDKASIYFISRLCSNINGKKI